MAFGGILEGVFGNSIFAVIQGLMNKIYDDKDDDLNKRIYESLESTTKNFFNKYKDTYTYPHDTFLARESNIQLIIKSLFYSENIDLLNQIDKRGYRNQPNVSEEHLSYFIMTLQKTMSEDFRLNKIITEKYHIQGSMETKENVKKLLNLVTAQNDTKNNDNPKRTDWKITDLSTGKELPFQIGKKYHQSFPNGVEYNYMVEEDTIYVEMKDQHGRWSYHELDLDGNAKNSKFPYELSEYKLVVQDNEVVNKNITPFTNGYYQVDFTLKWNRYGKAIFDNEDRLKSIELGGGWTVNNNEKTITPEEK